MELRRATPDDAVVLTASVADGFATFREWAPPEWRPPEFDEASVARLSEALAGPDIGALSRSTAASEGWLLTGRAHDDESSTGLPTVEYGRAVD